MILGYFDAAVLVANGHDWNFLDPTSIGWPNLSFLPGRPWICFAMPPKKRQRTSGGASNNKNAGQVPQTIEEVCTLRVKLKEWIVEAYGLRHGSANQMAYPLNDGGTFLDMVQQAWSGGVSNGYQYDILTDSLTFLKKIGLVDSSAGHQDFLDKFCKMQDKVLGNLHPSLAIDLLITVEVTVYVFGWGRVLYG